MSLKMGLQRLAFWYVEWAPWIAGALLLFCAAFFCGILFVGAGSFLSHPVTIQWATAIATVLAAIVAVGVAVYGQRRSRAQESEAGAYLLASTTSFLTLAAAHTNAGRFTIETAIRENMIRSDEDRDDVIKVVRSQLDPAMALLERIPLAAIARSDKRIAGFISLALDQLRVSCSRLSQGGGITVVDASQLTQLERIIRKAESLAQDVRAVHVYAHFTIEDARLFFGDMLAEMVASGSQDASAHQRRE